VYCTGCIGRSRIFRGGDFGNPSERSERALRGSGLTGTRSSAIAEGPRDASCQLKSCQLARNSAETTYTTSPDQIDGMKLEI